MKDKIIEEMARIIAFELCPNRAIHKKWGEEAQCYSDNNFSECTQIKNVVDKLYNAGYRKIPENAVVLTETEYNDLLSDEVKTIERDIAEYWATEEVATVAKELHKEGYRKIDDHAILVLRKAKCLEQKIRKETAEKFAERLKDALFDLGNVVTEKDIDEIAEEITEGK